MILNVTIDVSFLVGGAVLRFFVFDVVGRESIRLAKIVI